MKVGMGLLGRVGTIVAAAVSVVAVAAGCGGGNDVFGDQPTVTGLTTALGQVRDTEQTRVNVEYADVAALRALTGGGASDRFGMLVGKGYSPLAAAVRQLPDVTGFDPTKARVAISSGLGRSPAGELLGSFDVDAVDRKLGSVGGRPVKSTKEDDGTLLIRHPDHVLDVTDPLTDLGIASALNVVFVSPSTIAYGSGESTEALMRATGSGTLADSPEHRAVARCLGDGITVAVMSRLGERTSGVGVLARSASDVTELWCLATGSADEASQTAARVRAALMTGRSVRADQPWSALVAEPKVEVQSGEGNVVRVSARVPDDRPYGVFLSILDAGELDGLTAG